MALMVSLWLMDMALIHLWYRISVGLGRLLLREARVFEGVSVLSHNLEGYGS